MGKLDEFFQLLQSANLDDLLGWLGCNLDLFAGRWIAACAFFRCRTSVYIDLQQTWQIEHTWALGDV